MKQALRIAICQMKVEEHKSQNLKTAALLLRDAASKGAQFAVLPEIFNCPYTPSAFIDHAEDGIEGPSSQAISSLAKELGIYITAGSIPERCNDKFFNTSYTFDPKGRLIGTYRKIHLFDIDVPDKIRFRESDTFSPGNKILVMDTTFGKIGVMICYDIRFPELMRLMALAGADVVIVPAVFNMTTGPAHWELLMRTRAIDNQVYVIAASCARNEVAPLVAYGHSMITDPWGEILCKGSEKEEILSVTLDPEKLHTVRRNMPFLKHRRTDLYP